MFFTRWNRHSKSWASGKVNLIALSVVCASVLIPNWVRNLAKVSWFHQTFDSMFPLVCSAAKHWKHESISLGHDDIDLMKESGSKAKSSINVKLLHLMRSVTMWLSTKDAIYITFTRIEQLEFFLLSRHELVRAICFWYDDRSQIFRLCWLCLNLASLALNYLLHSVVVEQFALESHRNTLICIIKDHRWRFFCFFSSSINCCSYVRIFSISASAASLPNERKQTNENEDLAI